ncbi:damage-control phosphatase ARMT1 family protein [Halarcobacter anaerophilus]|uniref:damage-control phosphatase ARMT1 family protein n=1 Tax=Halarcobacter anaerophilus TaxID=877500 RepID=UPI0005C971A1|nr:ARMT1-like domain-containing protein [Halarcobacter anaerophilus]
MNITDDCVKCIVGQIEKATKTLKLDKDLAKSIMFEVNKRAENFSFKETPPFVAKDVYEYLAQRTNLKDPLKKMKQESIKKATGYLPFIQKKIDKSEDKLFTAIKAAVAGNVIDFATIKEFCLDEEINSIFQTDFAINDYKVFKNELEKTDSLIILSDNAGENIFDKILVKTLKKLYPKLEIYYATRGKAIINDVTLEEAIQSGIDKYCKVISTGVDTPGLEKKQASKEFLELFEKTPLILSKGMGNFECLEGFNDKRIFFLFKVKCAVVAKTVSRSLGEIVLKRG